MTPPASPSDQSGLSSGPLQDDHFHTVKHSWGHLKKSLLSYRRKIKARGEEKNDERLIALSQEVMEMALESPQEAREFLC